MEDEMRLTAQAKMGFYPTPGNPVEAQLSMF